MTGARKPNVKEPVIVEKDEPKADPVEALTPEQTEELDKVRPGDDKVPEGDLKFDGDEPEVEEDKVEPLTESEWYPGRPCRNCGSREYKWAIGWGTTCSECSPEAVAAREAAED